MYAVKGLTAWDYIHTGKFKDKKEAKFWLRGELIRQNFDKRYSKILSNEGEFEKFANYMIYEV